MAKTVLITGCSSGIGRAAAHTFSSKGWNVVATMRNPADAGDLAALPNLLVTALDVTDTSSIDQAIAAAITRFGAIDVMVNNAGFGAFGPFETAPQSLIDRQIATNLTGIFNTVRAALPTMRAQKSGIIINVASVGGLLTMPLNAIYHATKYAVVGFTEALNYELQPFGILSKFVAPGGVSTDFAGRSLSRTYEGDGAPYDNMITHVLASFQARSGTSYSTPEAIAEVIFAAATDGTHQIKYVAGADAAALLAARAPLDDAAYIAMVNARFGLT